MLAISNLPPPDSAQTDYYPSSDRVDLSLSDYERLLNDQGILPRLEDQYNWSGQGTHVEYEHDDVVPLESERVLGQGATAIVEAVRCRGILLSRKSVITSKRTRIKKEDVLREIGCLQTLRHRHVVQVIGSYTQLQTLSILQYPVADLNLEEMMMTIRRGSVSARDDRIAIRRFFSCLIQAVEYIYEILVRHMDIKPQNILVRRLSGRLAQVYITDFGSRSSTQYLSEEEAETYGFSPFTRHYAAQAVVLQEPRGFPADIFSLGCVFLEMQTAVLGSSYADLDEHLKRDTRRVPYHRNGIAINAFIERLSNHPRSLNGL
jgi:serine/threonine protein kinase